jgi:hypothetical protein
MCVCWCGEGEFIFCVCVCWCGEGAIYFFVRVLDILICIILQIEPECAYQQQHQHQQQLTT